MESCPESDKPPCFAYALACTNLHIDYNIFTVELQQKIKESWFTLLDKSAGKEYNVNCGNDTVYTSGGKVPSVLHRADQCVSMISPEPGRCGNIIRA